MVRYLEYSRDHIGDLRDLRVRSLINMVAPHTSESRTLSQFARLWHRNKFLTVSLSAVRVRWGNRCELVTKVVTSTKARALLWLHCRSFILHCGFPRSASLDCFKDQVRAWMRCSSERRSFALYSVPLLGPGYREIFINATEFSAMLNVTFCRKTPVWEKAMITSDFKIQWTNWIS